MKDRLYLRYSRNDLKRNWGVNTALMAILVLSAFLMATGCMVMERLLGGINQLFEEAKPPHFLQMHTGDYDAKALEPHIPRSTRGSSRTWWGTTPPL